MSESNTPSVPSTSTPAPSDSGNASTESVADNTALADAQASEASDENTTEASDGQGDSVEEGVAEATAKKGVAKEVKELKKKIKALKIKVDGKEEEVKLPFELEDSPEAIDYLRKELQLAKMGQKRANETATLQKEVAEFLRQLKADPMSVLSDPSIGIDIKAEIAKYIDKELENAAKTPEQIEHEKTQAELKALREERQKEKEAAEKQRNEMLLQQAYDEYDRQISSALEASSLPKNPYIIKKVADYMYLGLQEGIDVTAADVIPLVQEEMKKELNEMFGVMPEDVIEQFIGKDNLSKLRKKNVAKAKAMPTKVVDVGGGVKPSISSEPAKKVSYKDFFGKK